VKSFRFLENAQFRLSQKQTRRDAEKGPLKLNSFF